MEVHCLKHNKQTKKDQQLNLLCLN